jgi:hypothetical protein
MGERLSTPTEGSLPRRAAGGRFVLNPSKSLRFEEAEIGEMLGEIPGEGPRWRVDWSEAREKTEKGESTGVLLLLRSTGSEELEELTLFGRVPLLSLRLSPEILPTVVAMGGNNRLPPPLPLCELGLLSSDIDSFLVDSRDNSLINATGFSGTGGFPSGYLGDPGRNEAEEETEKDRSGVEAINPRMGNLSSNKLCPV